MDNIKLGKIGEDAAAEVLRAKGYKIMCRNYRCRRGEVDIIASRGPCLCFIEVKTRSSAAYGRPCESVTPAKQKHIKMAASCYLNDMKAKGFVPMKVSFDVIEIVMEHLEKAF